MMTHELANFKLINVTTQYHHEGLEILVFDFEDKLRKACNVSEF